LSRNFSTKSLGYTPGMDCIFCKIARKELPAEIVYEDDGVIGFRDLNPQAPTHVLVIPKTHVDSLAAANDAKMLGRLLLAAAEVARRENLESGGYRVILNNGQGAGQSVFHLHAHVLGGRGFAWPPG
jgi:histidine triad (HIT) family protein